MQNMQKDNADFAHNERVIVYGLRGSNAQYNSLFARVQCYDPRRNRFCVVFTDVNIDMGLWLDGGSLFFTQRVRDYFARPFDSLDLITACTTVVHTAGRKRVVATERIPAGTVLGCPSFRLTLTWPQIHAVEAEFTAFASDSMPTLMARSPGPFTVVFEPNYNPVLPFIGKLAEAWSRPTIQTLTGYDPTSDECLLRNWRRCSGIDLVWYEFWRTKLAHLTALDVWHVWHAALNFAWPSSDRLTLVFGQTICLMQNPPERLLEYQKVADGLQDAAVDNLAHKCYSSVILTPPELSDFTQAFFVETVEAGQPVYLDSGAQDTSSLCDTVLNCLFMSEVDGTHWLSLYKNIMRNLGTAVALNLQTYINDNIARVSVFSVIKPDPSVRTTPAVHAPPAQRFPLCTYCAKPRQFPYVCARCKNAAYCSKACQTAAWQTHKRECAPVAK